MPLAHFEGEQANPQLIRYQQLLQDGSGDYLTQADVGSMTLYVFETETETDETSGGVALTVADCVFDTMQSWDADSVGFNVQVPISGAYLAEAGRTYRIEVKVTPAEGEAYFLRHTEIETIRTYSAGA